MDFHYKKIIYSVLVTSFDNWHDFARIFLSSKDLFLILSLFLFHGLKKGLANFTVSLKRVGNHGPFVICGLQLPGVLSQVIKGHGCPPLL